MRQDLLEANPISPPAEAKCLSRAAEGRLARRARSKTLDKQTERRLSLCAPSGAFHFLPQAQFSGHMVQEGMIYLPSTPYRRRPCAHIHTTNL
jgi:hypothetical protein